MLCKDIKPVRLCKEVCGPFLRPIHALIVFILGVMASWFLLVILGTCFSEFILRVLEPQVPIDVPCLNIPVQEEVHIKQVTTAENSYLIDFRVVVPVRKTIVVTSTYDSKTYTFYGNYEIEYK